MKHTKSIIKQLCQSPKMSDRLLAHSAEIVLDTLDALEIREINVCPPNGDGTVVIKAKYKRNIITYFVTENGVALRMSL